MGGVVTTDRRGRSDCEGEGLWASGDRGQGDGAGEGGAAFVARLWLLGAALSLEAYECFT